MDAFEQFLKRQQPRALPPAWRAGILAAARECQTGVAPTATASKAATQEPERGHPWWLAWLWPSPTAWAAVACTWLVILGFDAASQPAATPDSLSSAGFPSIQFPSAFAIQRHQIEQLFRCDQEGAEPRDALLPRSAPGAWVFSRREAITA